MTVKGLLQIYARALGLLRPECARSIVLAVAGLLVVALQFVEPILFGRLVSLLGSSGREGGVSIEIWPSALKLIGIWLLVALAGIAAGAVIAVNADRMAHRRRLAMMSHYFSQVLEFPSAFYSSHHSGELLKVMLQGPDQLFGLWLGFFRGHLEAAIAIFVLLPLTLLLNWKLAILLICLTIVFAVVTLIVVAKTEREQQEIESFHTALAARASDVLTSASVIQSFGRIRQEVQAIQDVMQRVISAQFPVLNLWALGAVFSRIAASLTVIMVLGLGVWLHLRGDASIADVVSFAGFSVILVGRLDQFTSFVSQLFFQAPVLAEFFAVLDTPPAVSDARSARRVLRLKGDVVFSDVSFAYPDRGQAVSNLSFVARAGDTVALVGHTGAGKTTAISLLYRAYEPQSGRISIDGIDIRDIAIESLRANVGVVFQDSILLNRSIADNLRIGNPSATYEELVKATTSAHAHDFVCALPQGYDTIVAEHGRTLSGGERQRLCIARAILKDAPILLLDEGTSALDVVTESSVQVALRRLMFGRTTFLITHRLSLVRTADLVLVFDQGRIAEAGSFDELAQMGGILTELVG